MKVIFEINFFYVISVFTLYLFENFKYQENYRLSGEKVK